MKTIMKTLRIAVYSIALGIMTFGCLSTVEKPMLMQPVGLAAPLLVTSLVTSTNGTLPVGCCSASFANIGTNIATVNAVALPASTAIGFGPLSPGYYLPQIPYSATGTIFRIDYTQE